MGRHAAFIRTRLLAALAVCVLAPPYLALRGAPELWETLVFLLALAFVVKGSPVKGVAAMAGPPLLLVHGLATPGVLVGDKEGVTDATPNITHDLYPTVLEMTGIAAQKTLVDGVSLAPLLKTGAKVERDALYWHYPHYHGGGATPHSAIRKGDFRLIHFYEDDRDELYDLAHDIGETKDLAAAQPAKAKELRAQLDAYLKSVGAQMPTPNPNYDPNAGKAKGPAAKKAGK